MCHLYSLHDILLAIIIIREINLRLQHHFTCRVGEWCCCLVCIVFSCNKDSWYYFTVHRILPPWLSIFILQVHRSSEHLGVFETKSSQNDSVARNRRCYWGKPSCWNPDTSINTWTVGTSKQIVVGDVTDVTTHTTGGPITISTITRLSKMETIIIQLGQSVQSIAEDMKSSTDSTLEHQQAEINKQKSTNY